MLLYIKNLPVTQILIIKSRSTIISYSFVKPLSQLPQPFAPTQATPKNHHRYLQQPNQLCPTPSSAKKQLGHCYGVLNHRYRISQYQKPYSKRVGSFQKKVLR